MNEEAVKRNIKIYPIYKMFAWDLLFYYAIAFLFLTQAKGLSASQVLLADSSYPLFRLLAQIPCNSIVKSSGKVKSLLFGNIFVSISILILILSNSLGLIIFSNLLCALGFSFKGLCESSFLYDCLAGYENRRDFFSKLDGKGNARYYVVDAISSLSTGFLFVFNPYLPMVLCFIMCIISTILSLEFEEPMHYIEEIKEKQSFKERYLNFKNITSYIIKSNRLRSLLLYSGLFTGTLFVFITLKNSLLVDLGIPDQFFGLIFAFMQIISAITARNQSFFHKKFRNKTLTMLCLPLVSTILITGLLVVCKVDYNILLISTFFMIATFAIVKGPFYTLIKRYLNSFSTSSLNTHIYTAAAFVDSISESLLCLFASYLLKIQTTAFGMLIIGGLLLIVFIFLLDYMKTRVGLKPEEYAKSDIEFSELK